MTVQERTELQIIGNVTIEFVSFQPAHIILSNNIKNNAYRRLLVEARRQYQGDIDIKNIVTVQDPLAKIRKSRGYLK